MTRVTIIGGHGKIEFLTESLPTKAGRQTAGVICAAPAGTS